MQKSFRQILLVAILTMMTSSSYALIGAFMGTPLAIGIGGALTLSCSTYVATENDTKRTLANKIIIAPCTFLPTISRYTARLNQSEYRDYIAYLLFQGVLFLENDSSQISFTSITTEIATEKDITHAEQEMFNIELNLVNAVLNEASLQVDVEGSAQLWLSAQDHLHPETMLALYKLIK